MTDHSFSLQLCPGRAVVRVAGSDSRGFLQNLLTTDVAHLVAGLGAYGALLSPQGKILHDMFVVFDGEDALIDCAVSQAPELVKRLSFYRLRAKLTIALVPDLGVGVSSDQPAAAIRFVDPRLAAMGWRCIVPAASLAPQSDYAALELLHGLPQSEADIGSGVHFPHEANLDQLHGISFHKGCYVGQEIVSRMEHRGTARNRMMPVGFDGLAPAPGSAITAGETMLGEVLSVHGSRGMALLRLDRLAETKAPLLTGTVRVHVHKPDWAQFALELPESAG